MFSCDNLPNLSCGDCKYFNGMAELDNVKSTCKRIDHKIIKFAVPWFKSYDCGQYSHCICSDFEPAKWRVDVCKHWTNFEDYWKLYVQEILPYGNTDTTVAFTLHNNTKIRYEVPLLDFVYNHMINGNILNAIEKVYYKIDSDPKGFGYKLIHEKIKGVEINGEYKIVNQI